MVPISRIENESLALFWTTHIPKLQFIMRPEPRTAPFDMPSRIAIDFLDWSCSVFFGMYTFCVDCIRITHCYKHCNQRWMLAHPVNEYQIRRNTCRGFHS